MRGPMRFKLTLLTVAFLIACSESFELGKVNYSDEELNVAVMMQHLDYWWEQEEYDSVRKAMTWIKNRDPRYYDSKLTDLNRDLLEKEGRYERALQEWGKVFYTDSIDETKNVPKFYFTVGKIWENQARLPQSSALDTTLMQRAVEYYVKCYQYALSEDPNLQSAAYYFAGLALAKIGKYEEAYKTYNKLLSLEEYKGRDYHIKAYFKRDNVRDITDRDLTEEQRQIYRERYVIEAARKDSMSKEIDAKFKSTGLSNDTTSSN